MLSVLPLYEVMSSNSGSRGLIHIISIPNINGLNSSAPTDLFTVPTGSRFVLTGASVRLTNVVGTPTVGQITIKDATASVDLIAATTLTGLTSTSVFFPLLMTSAATPIVPTGNVVVAEMTTAYSVATTVTLSVDLMGYLI